MRKNMILLALAITSIAGCKKELSRGDADFTVITEKTTLNLGDTAKFSFGGNPDEITFYSGEVGKRYEFRGRTSAEGTSVLTFRTQRLNGGVQPNSLGLMISSDFAGVVSNDATTTVQNITKASWTDITSRAALATSPTAVSSGNVNLTDFASQDKPVFIAFKYMGAAGSIQNRWYIDLFSLRNNLADGTSYEIANNTYSNTATVNYGVSTYSPSFVSYAVQNTFTWTFNASSFAINGAATVAAATSQSEAWLIMGPLDLKRVTPDVGEGIKTASQKTSTIKYTYKYPAKGTYNAVFSGGRVDIQGQRYVMKPVTITVN